jgi:Trk K+ transport system NAD-binding subunit
MQRFAMRLDAEHARRPRRYAASLAQEGYTDVTILMDACDRLDQRTRSTEARVVAGNISAGAHLGAIKRFFTGVLIAVLAEAAVAAVMALKTAYYLSHFS